MGVWVWIAIAVLAAIVLLGMAFATTSPGRIRRRGEAARIAKLPEVDDTDEVEEPEPRNVARLR
jgi:hypothetical protein